MLPCTHVRIVFRSVPVQQNVYCIAGLDGQLQAAGVVIGIVGVIVSRAAVMYITVVLVVGE